MLPQGGHLSTTPVRAQLINPWMRDDLRSRHWGPVALNDASQGLLVRLWEARAVGDSIYISAPGIPETLFYSHSLQIMQVSLAFNQNGDPCVAFVDSSGDPYLRWYDPLESGMTTTPLPAGTITPRVAMDELRAFNVSNSDIVLGYVRAGTLRYRLQRDRFGVEYTPTIGDGGPTAPATKIRHVSRNTGLRFEFMTDGAGDEDWTLPMVIDELAARANLPPERLGLAMMDWSRLVRGYMVTTGYGAHNAMQHLSQVFLFDPVSADGRVNFVPRGRDAVALIPEGDMIDDGEDIEHDQDRRHDSISIPRVLHLNYYDMVGGLNTAKQMSERPDGTRAEGEQSLQTAVVMTADESATCVGIQHAMMVEQQKGELNFSLTSKWLGLTEADAIHVSVGGRVVRGVIAKVGTGDGEQSYKVIRDRQSLYTMQVEGIPQEPPATPPSSVAGPTLIEILDIPIQRDSHDMLGFYAAVTGVFPAWPGASVDLSLDGGENYIASHTTRSGSIMGTLSTALDAHPHEYPDTVNSCEVAIRTPNALLENSTLAGMMNRANRALIGDEVVAFADSDEVTPGVWELSHWLRGREGTDSVAHAIGERFVMLNTALFIPAELSWLGRPLTFRAATLGRPLDEATVTTITFTGQSQRERRPAYLQARRDGADAVISWQGVGRLGGGVHVAMGAYFSGYVVTITDGSTTQTHDTAASSLTTSLAAFSSPVTVRVQQRNQLTGLGPYIEVTI